MPNEQPADGGSCDAAKVQSFLGKPESAAIAEQARQQSGAKTVRWLRPGQIVTMEYLNGRLNVNVDEKNRVKSFTCG